MKVRQFWQTHVIGGGIQAHTLKHLMCFLYGWAKRLRPNFKNCIESLDKAIMNAFEAGNLTLHENLVKEYNQVLKEQELY